MIPIELLSRIQSHFGEAILAVNATALDPFALVQTERIADVGRYLRNEPDLAFDILNNLCAVDYLETDAKKLAKAGFEPHFEILYHLSSFRFPGRRFTLKVNLPRWKDETVGELPELPTVSSIWRTADWHEREVYDLFGVRFLGHPDLRRILMAEDWVGYPLRKDYEFPLEYRDIRCR